MGNFVRFFFEAILFGGDTRQNENDSQSTCNDSAERKWNEMKSFFSLSESFWSLWLYVFFLLLLTEISESFDWLYTIGTSKWTANNSISEMIDMCARAPAYKMIGLRWTRVQMWQKKGTLIISVYHRDDWMKTEHRQRLTMKPQNSYHMFALNWEAERKKNKRKQNHPRDTHWVRDSVS